MTKTRQFLTNACYHLMARGNHRQKVFFKKNDFEFYLKQIKRYKKKFNFLLYGYCLMPNHIHLIGETKESHQLSKFMHGLQRSYTAYFNTKYDKVGHLWQGRFKSKPILKDKYLIDCIRYVEYNPIKAKMVLSPDDYPFSSSKERSHHEQFTPKLLDPLPY